MYVVTVLHSLFISRINVDDVSHFLAFDFSRRKRGKRTRWQRGIATIAKKPKMELVGDRKRLFWSVSKRFREDVGVITLPAS